MSSRSEIYNSLVYKYPDVVGYWVVIGGGYGCTSPRLGILHGRYSDVVAYALDMRNFITYGVGGRIEPLNVVEVTTELVDKRKRLIEEQVELEARLSEVKKEFEIT